MKTPIGKGAFSKCKKLTSVTTGENLIEIGDEAFEGGYRVDCFLSSVDLSRSQKLTTIGEYAFEGQPITFLKIPDSVTDIKYQAFYNCWKLSDVKLPANLINIGPYAFEGTALTSIDIPEKVKTIGKYAFANLALKKVVIPHSVTNAGDYAFSQCTSLTAVDISGFNLTLGVNAFYVCKNINHVHISDELGVSYYLGKAGLPTETSYYFQIGSDGKCPAAVCPFREGDKIVGDVDGNGSFTILDIVTLANAYKKGNAANYVSAADMNGDDKITLLDIVLLCNHYKSRQK